MRSGSLLRILHAGVGGARIVAGGYPPCGPAAGKAILAAGRGTLAQARPHQDAGCMGPAGCAAVAAQGTLATAPGREAVLVVSVVLDMAGEAAGPAVPAAELDRGDALAVAVPGDARSTSPAVADQADYIHAERLAALVHFH